MGAFGELLETLKGDVKGVLVSELCRVAQHVDALDLDTLQSNGIARDRASRETYIDNTHGGECLCRGKCNGEAGVGGESTQTNTRCVETEWRGDVRSPERRASKSPNPCRTSHASQISISIIAI